MPQCKPAQYQCSITLPPLHLNCAQTVCKLEVPKLWWGQQTLVHGGGHPWRVHHHCALRELVQLDPVFRLGLGADIGGVKARSRSNKEDEEEVDKEADVVEGSSIADLASK